MARHDVEFAEYFSARFDRARRIAFALCGDWVEAEELAQEAFVRLYAHWTRIRPDTVDGYLRTVLTRLFLSRGRGQRGREHVVPEPPDLPQADRSGDADDRAAVVSALLQVPPRQRAVLVLRYALDLSVEQVAQILRCSDGTVKSQAARGLRNFQNAYQASTFEPHVS
ncbi:MAG TPA: SigE family RNA polymerase sigma factor [Actinoplanes sp.]|nr:SigE family RNA polymerase sigma factor [Actinoplanes sp.]